MKAGFKYYSLILSLSLMGSSLLHGTSKHLRQLNDIYIIIFATQEGFTGHAGFAVDNYDVFIQDKEVDGQRVSVKDTLTNGTLSYFDMFGPADIQWDQYKENLEARFYKFPRSSAEENITIDYLMSKGIPHEYKTSCDALVRIPSNAKDDIEFLGKIDQLIEKHNYFNPSFYNCTDFVLKCIEVHSGKTIEAKEDLFFLKANTPNKLYKELIKLDDTLVLKEPGDIINNSFFDEIILKKYLINLNLY